MGKALVAITTKKYTMNPDTKHIGLIIGPVKPYEFKILCNRNMKDVIMIDEMKGFIMISIKFILILIFLFNM